MDTNRIKPYILMNSNSHRHFQAPFMVKHKGRLPYWSRWDIFRKSQDIFYIVSNMASDEILIKVKSTLFQQQYIKLFLRILQIN